MVLCLKARESKSLPGLLTTYTASLYFNSKRKLSFLKIIILLAIIAIICGFSYKFIA